MPHGCSRTAPSAPSHPASDLAGLTAAFERPAALHPSQGVPRAWLLIQRPHPTGRRSWSGPGLSVRDETNPGIEPAYRRSLSVWFRRMLHIQVPKSHPNRPAHGPTRSAFPGEPAARGHSRTELSTHSLHLHTCATLWPARGSRRSNKPSQPMHWPRRAIFRSTTLRPNREPRPPHLQDSRPTSRRWAVRPPPIRRPAPKPANRTDEPCQLPASRSAPKKRERALVGARSLSGLHGRPRWADLHRLSISRRHPQSTPSPAFVKPKG